MKTLIFDFDGTIADTLDIILDMVNQLSDKFGYRKIEKSRISQLRNKKPQEIFKKLGIPVWKLPFLAKEIRSELNKKISLAKPVKNMKNALKTLKQHGYILGILSSNSEENIKAFLGRNKIDEFDFVYSGSSFFGKSKVLHSLLKEKNLQIEEIIYIGDETRDIEAAKKVCIKCCAVAWGFQGKKILATLQPDFIVDKPSELMKLIGKKDNKQK